MGSRAGPSETGRISGEVGRGMDGVATGGQADLIGAGHASRDLFGFRLALRPAVRAGWRVADGVGQHRAQLGLRLGRFPRKAFLPVRHRPHVGMAEAEVNGTGDD